MMENNEFMSALDLIVKEKGIDKKTVLDAMKLGLISAYKRNFNSLENVRIDINEDTGAIKVFSYLTVVKKRENVETEILLSAARKLVPDIEVGETIETEVTPKDFGRVAASTAKQVVIQKLKEAEKESIMDEFSDKEGELLVGMASREDAKNYYIDLGRVHGLLSKTEIIAGEKIQMGSSVKVYVTKIDATGKTPLILLSRIHYGFLKRLLELEVPELNEGLVVLNSVAREAGIRSKISVSSLDQRVDAVGACIGERGSRINRIIDELMGEKIDVILYDKDPTVYIANALSPAKNVKVYITDAKNQEA